jgi:hypothetical protein
MDAKREFEVDVEGSADMMEHGGERGTVGDECTVCELAIIFRRVERWNTVTRESENQVTDVGYCRFHYVIKLFIVLLPSPSTVLLPSPSTVLLPSPSTIHNIHTSQPHMPHIRYSLTTGKFYSSTSIINFSI